MEINHKEENGIVFLAFKGRLDGTSAVEAEETVNTIFKGENNRLLFDFEFLEYLSSAEVFEVSGFGAIIPIADSVEAGIKELT
jgi:anti-anti-sigma regulatory factor